MVLVKTEKLTLMFLLFQTRHNKIITFNMVCTQYIIALAGLDRKIPLRELLPFTATLKTQRGGETVASHLVNDATNI